MEESETDPPGWTTVYPAIVAMLLPLNIVCEVCNI